MGGSDQRRLLAALRRAGYAVTRAGSGHQTVRDRRGRRVTTLPTSPSDWRTWRNTLADLRRAGFRWPNPQPRGVRG